LTWGVTEGDAEIYDWIGLYREEDADSACIMHKYCKTSRCEPVNRSLHNKGRCCACVGEIERDFCGLDNLQCNRHTQIEDDSRCRCAPFVCVFVCVFVSCSFVRSFVCIHARGRFRLCVRRRRGFTVGCLRHFKNLNSADRAAPPPYLHPKPYTLNP
jgi:hypothetical protein